MVGTRVRKKSVFGGTCLPAIFAILLCMVFGCDVESDPGQGDDGQLPDPTAEPTSTPSQAPEQFHITDMYPGSGTDGVFLNTNIYITFEVEVIINSGKIRIYRLDDTLFESIDVTGSSVRIMSNSIAEVKPQSDFESLAGYYILIDENAFLNKTDSTVVFAGITDATDWTFTTGSKSDSSAPELDAGRLVPAIKSTAAIDTDIVIAFNENVAPLPDGVIRLYTEAGALVFSAELNDADTVSWTDARTIAVHIAEELPGDTVYYILISENAFTDYTDNPFAGIADPLAWKFATCDNVNPSVVISSGVNSPTNEDPIAIMISFDDEITAGSFTAEDIIVGNGSIQAGSFLTADNAVFTASIVPEGDGVVSVDLDAGVCTDLSGNPNNQAGRFSVMYDGTSPEVYIASAYSGATNTTPLELTIVFSEKVIGFEESDLAPVNANVNPGSLSTDDNATFNVTIVPVEDGIVSVTIPGYVCTDPAGNKNKEGIPFEFTYDSVRPGVVISSATQARTGANPLPVTIAFGESVIGFDASDIIVGNGTVISIDGGPAAYTCEIVPNAAGAVTVDIGDSVCTDAAGNRNTAGARLSRTFINTVGIDSCATFFSSAVNIINFNINVNSANTNRVVVVYVTAADTGENPVRIFSVRIAGIEMALVPQSSVSAVDGDRSWVSAFYYFPNPKAGYSTISVTYDSPCTCKVGAIILYDTRVHMNSGPIGSVLTANTSGPATSISASLYTTNAYSTIIDGICGSDSSNSYIVTGTGQTIRWSRSKDTHSAAQSTMPTTAAGINQTGWMLGTTMNLRLLMSVAEIIIAQ